MCDATPVQDASELSEENLTTINYNTLDSLREEDESTPQQSAGRHASQEVSEELINQYMRHANQDKSIQNALSKPDIERHLCALKLLTHFFSKEELAESNTCLHQTELEKYHGPFHQEI